MLPHTDGFFVYLFFVFVFLVETGFHHVSQAGLELLTSGDPSTSASQHAGITGVSQQSQHFRLKGAHLQLHRYCQTALQRDMGVALHP